MEITSIWMRSIILSWLNVELNFNMALRRLIFMKVKVISSTVNISSASNKFSLQQYKSKKLANFQQN